MFRICVLGYVLNNVCKCAKDRKDRLCHYTPPGFTLVHIMPKHSCLLYAFRSAQTLEWGMNMPEAYLEERGKGRPLASSKSDLVFDCGFENRFGV